MNYSASTTGGSINFPVTLTNTGTSIFINYQLNSAGNAIYNEPLSSISTQYCFTILNLLIDELIDEIIVIVGGTSKSIAKYES
jgi:hypothetical protein